MLVGGAEHPPQISFSLPDLRSFQDGGVSVWLSQGHRRQGSRGPSVSSWGQRAGEPLVVAMAAGAIPTPGSGEGHAVIPHSLPSTCLSSSEALLAWGATDRNQSPLKDTVSLTLPFQFHNGYHGVQYFRYLPLEWGSSISITHIQYKSPCQWFYKAWLWSWANSFYIKLLH